jgi:hypothetical protein
MILVITFLLYVVFGRAALGPVQWSFFLMTTVVSGSLGVPISSYRTYACFRFLCYAHGVCLCSTDVVLTVEEVGL